MADEIDAIAAIKRVPLAALYRFAEAMELAWSMGCDFGARCAAGRPDTPALRDMDEAELAAVMVRIHQNQGVVTERDLVQAGVSPASIDRHRESASALAAQTMAAREQRAATDGRAA